MIKFMLKSFLLISVLFILVLFGMQHANDGIRNMKGYNDPNFEGAFQITEAESGDLEAAVLGERVTSHDIQEKHQKLQEMEAFNIFSKIGAKFSEGIAFFFQKILEFITKTTE
ncbi:YqxA family protein [Bacillus salitolerans]|uniref:YqxA family protein n=1 Tax=Bacillus salitolerans TaxID=1437434 RepID=A0ABW4LR70_9BACI